MSKNMYMLMIEKIHHLRNVQSIIIFTSHKDQTNWAEEKKKFDKLFHVEKYDEMNILTKLD